MALCSPKHSVVTLEKKLKVIAMLKDLFKSYRNFQNYRHHLVSCCPDKWGSTVHVFYINAMQKSKMSVLE